jgi:hypothetical protein
MAIAKDIDMGVAGIGEWQVGAAIHAAGFMGLEVRMTQSQSGIHIRSNRERMRERPESSRSAAQKRPPGGMPQWPPVFLPAGNGMRPGNSWRRSFNSLSSS